MGEAGGRKLEPERYAVEPTTDVDHRTCCFGVQCESGRRKPGALHEQLDGFQPKQPPKIKISSDLRQLERRHPEDQFPRNGKWFPACGNDSDPWTPAEHLLSKLGAGIQQMLAVVHDQ